VAEIRSDANQNKALMRYALILCLAVGIACCGVNAQAPTSSASAKGDSSKNEVRNNAASLLDDLLNQEKHVSTILIIKHASPAVKQLIKAISKTADNGQKSLETLANNDKTLNLHSLQLPPGETATRDAISKTKEHELLFSSGTKFEIDLLLSQTDALDYGSHLAKIAEENSTSSEEAREFHTLDLALNALYRRVVAQIRALPSK
jgi:hypothetical protein